MALNCCMATDAHRYSKHAYVSYLSVTGWGWWGGLRDKKWIRVLSGVVDRIQLHRTWLSDALYTVRCKL